MAEISDDCAHDQLCYFNFITSSPRNILRNPAGARVACWLILNGRWSWLCWRRASGRRTERDGGVIQGVKIRRGGHFCWWPIWKRRLMTRLFPPGLMLSDFSPGPRSRPAPPDAVTPSELSGGRRHQKPNCNFFNPFFLTRVPRKGNKAKESRS